jgi:DUF1680 family protein
MQVNEREVSLRQVTKYPWDGEVHFEIGIASSQRFTLHLRVPAWCEGWSVAVNGEQLAGNDEELINGYVPLTREWNPGDVIEYRMEMPIRATWAHPAVHDLQGRVALERGPIVYCLEGVDHPGIPLDRIVIDPSQVTNAFQAEHNEDLLGGITMLRGKGMIVEASGWESALYRNKEASLKSIDITAIPYYAWDNRAPGEMRVWLQARGG